METQKILMLLDENTISNNVEKAFYHANFQAIRTSRFDRAISLLTQHLPHAFILGKDITDQKQSELTSIMKNEFRKTAFVILTNHLDHHQRIHAIEEGADDLISSDELDEVVAKVRALIRRISIVCETPKCLSIRDISINLDTHKVLKNNTPVELTYTQFKLLYLLASKRDSIFSRNEIIQKVWGKNTYVTNRTVDVHVKRLREKLGEYGEHEEEIGYIQTIHGLGYRFS